MNQQYQISTKLLGHYLLSHWGPRASATHGCADRGTVFGTHDNKDNWFQKITMMQNHYDFTIGIRLWCIWRDQTLSSHTLSRNRCMLFSLFSLVASILCRPIEAINCVSCSSNAQSAAFRSGPDNSSFIWPSSSNLHSILKMRIAFVDTYFDFAKMYTGGQRADNFCLPSRSTLKIKM